MKRLLLLFTIFTCTLSSAQLLNPVKWTFETKHLGNSEFELIFVADIDNHWAIYSQFLDEGGPLPTTFKFDTNANIEFIGNVLEDETNRVTKMDMVFEMEVTKFYNQARFIQKVKLLSDSATLKGNLDYMTCDDEQCTFKPDNPFQFSISASGESTAIATTGANINIDNISVNNLLYGAQPQALSKSDVICEGQTVSAANAVTQKGKSLWSIFGLGFLGGLLALLTPCVFPMIPLTVSFFTKKVIKKAAQEYQKQCSMAFLF